MYTHTRGRGTTHEGEGCHTPVLPAHGRTAVNSRPSWYTQGILGQPELTVTQERMKEGKKGEGTGREDQNS